MSNKDQAYDSQGNHIGMFDGEYLYDFNGNMKLRVDDEEVYTLDIPCKHIANFDGTRATNFDGSLLFKVEE